MMKTWFWAKAFLWRGVQKAAHKIADGLIVFGDWADRRVRYARNQTRRGP